MKRVIWTAIAVVIMISMLAVIAGCGEAEPAESTAAPTTAATTATSTEDTGATTATATGKTIKLTYNNFFPPTNYHSILAQWWCNEIEKRTNGGIKFEYLPGATLSTADKVYDSVLEGMCDIGLSCVVYNMGRFPATEILDRPIGHANPWVTSVVANEFYQKFKPAEFDDTHVLYFHGSNMANAFLAKKPVQKVADFNGLIIRSTGVGAQIAEAMGATGYAAPVNETYELLSKGVIDGSMSGMDVLIGWKQAEVVKYVVNLGAANSSTAMYAVMNKDKWESLPEEYQKIITEVSADMPPKHGMVWMYYDKVSAEYFMGLGEGREMIQVPADDAVNFEKVAQAVIDKFKADKASLNLPIDEYISFFAEQTAAWLPKMPTPEDAVKFVETELKPLTAAK
jgi:TRAP-type C4-dicarboxylate transport system substrate-binding protein